MTVTINGTGTAALTDASGNFSVRTSTATSPVTVGRVDSSNEGGQIDFCRSSDNANAWGIDVYGGTSTPSLRFIDNTAALTRASIDGSGNFAFNSGYGSSAVVYGCRAWVNFDGTTTPPTIRASGNVSGVTRSSTGIYIVTFTSAMPDGNYVMNGNAIQVGSGNGPIISISNGTTPSASSISVTCTNDAGAAQNASIIHLTFHR